MLDDWNGPGAMQTPQLWWVGIYLTDRAYGGPEEGGWYFDCGELVTDASFYDGRNGMTPRSFTNMEDAYHFANECQTYLDATDNVGRHPVSSVLSEGIYTAMVMESSLPAYFPERKPHYE